MSNGRKSTCRECQFEDGNHTRSCSIGTALDKAYQLASDDTKLEINRRICNGETLAKALEHEGITILK